MKASTFSPSLIAAAAEILRRRESVALERARVEAALAAKAGGERFFIEDKEGGGEVKMMVHPLFYHFWGRKLGYQCWSDRKFCAEFLRDNAFARVKSRSKKPKVGWRGHGTGGIWGKKLAA